MNFLEKICKKQWITGRQSGRIDWKENKSKRWRQKMIQLVEGYNLKREVLVEVEVKDTKGSYQLQNKKWNRIGRRVRSRYSRIQ